jgi:CheY-like chemotaxis protein
MTAPIAGARTRVLVVDDYADDLRMFCLMLETWGCEVRACGEPAQGLSLAREFRPHLVMLDLAMPQMSGLQLAAELRAAGLPKFLLAARTGFADAENRQRCLEAGFDEFLVKPEPLDQLRSLIIRAGELEGCPVN